MPQTKHMAALEARNAWEHVTELTDRARALAGNAHSQREEDQARALAEQAQAEAIAARKLTKGVKALYGDAYDGPPATPEAKALEEARDATHQAMEIAADTIEAMKALRAELDALKAAKA